MQAIEQESLFSLAIRFVDKYQRSAQAFALTHQFDYYRPQTGQQIGLLRDKAAAYLGDA